MIVTNELARVIKFAIAPSTGVGAMMSRERESIGGSTVVTSAITTNIVEKGDELFIADEVCRSHLQEYDVGLPKRQRSKRDTLTELTAQSTSSPIQLRLWELVISTK